MPSSGQRERERERRFDAAYTAHRQTLFAYFLGRTADREQALDLLQELFARLWRSLDSFESLPSDRRPVWLFSIARNLVVDHYRARATRQRAQAQLGQQRPIDWTAAPEPAAVEGEQAAALHAAIGRLPDELRVVLVLSVLDGRTSAEIGTLLGRPPGTVRYQLAEARQRLANDLRLKEEVAGDTRV
jgi:RNA polymerase sigma-70 factor (ECF subfamily)